MKQLNTITLFFSLGLMLFFCACKKYPEDGKWSKKTVKDRLIHKWELKECLMDGVDLIDLQHTFKYINPSNQLQDSVVYTLKDFNLEIKYYTLRINGKRTKVYDVYYSVINVLYSNTCICSGNEWKLIEHKNKIEFKHEFKAGFGYGSNTSYLHLLYNETNEAIKYNYSIF